MRTLVLAALALTLLLPAASASAATEVQAVGPVQATLAYADEPAEEYGVCRTGWHLTIARDGRPLYDGAVPAGEGPDTPPEPCAPASPEGRPGKALRIVDLEGDGEPEVMVTLFSGGAHCCYSADIWRLAPDGSGYTVSAHGFGDPYFALEDLDGDGRPEFRSADATFAYLFSSFAASAMPVLVYRYAAGELTDVTGAFPKLVRMDARRWRRAYRHRRGRRDGEQLGPLAAWAADQLRLGHADRVRRTLRAELRHGRLRGPLG
ncbi:MAG TPA: hypothetical protein VF533_00470, partial [Solirubrobacteraceae bacterium]